MASKEDDRTSDVRERPSEKQGEAGVQKLAQTGQEIPKDMKDTLQQRAELRKMGLTNSSRMLPGLEFSGDDLAKLIEKATRKSANSDGATSLEPRTDLPPGWNPSWGEVPPPEIFKDADALRDALKGPGVDAGAIFKTLEGKSAKEIEGIFRVYEDLREGDLVGDLRDKLSPEDFRRVVKALNPDAGPEVFQAADTIRKSIGGLDPKGGISKTLEHMTPDQIEKLEIVYGDLYGVQLKDALRGVLTGAELDKALKLLEHPPVGSDSKLPEQSGSSDNPLDKIDLGKLPPVEAPVPGDQLSVVSRPGEVERIDLPALLKDADTINQVVSGKRKDVTSLLESLESKTPDEIKQLQDVYKDKYGIALKFELPAALTGDNLARALKVLDSTSTRQVTDSDSTNRPTMFGQKLEASSVPANIEPMTEVEEDERAVERIRDNATVKAEHAKLEQLAESRITNADERKDFVANMKKLEERTAERENEYRRQFEAQGLSRDKAEVAAAKKVQNEVVETYKSVERLLTPDSRAPVSDQDRVYLAEQCMKHAADPYSISQGKYQTCNVATIETRTFTNDPAAAAKLVADVATTGKYTTNGNPPVTVELDRDSLKKHGQSAELSKNNSEVAHRDYASQLFELTAANIGLQRRNLRENPNGQLRYEQREPTPGDPLDNGERLVDYSKDDPKTGKPPFEIKDPMTGEPVRSTDIGLAWEIAEISKDITPQAAGVVAVEAVHPIRGREEMVGLHFFLANIGENKPADLSSPQAIQKVRDVLKSHPELDPTTRRKIEVLLKEVETMRGPEKKNRQPVVENAGELKDLISKAKAEGNLPLIIAVNTGNEPFWTDSAGGSAGGSAEQHVVTVTDYDPATGEVKMQNQWSTLDNHTVTVDQLYRTMRVPSENLTELKRQVEENRKSGDIDYSKEFELLRWLHDEGKVEDDRYFQRVAELQAENVFHHLTKGGDKRAYDRANQTFATIAAKMGERSEQLWNLSAALLSNAQTARDATIVASQPSDE